MNTLEMHIRVNLLLQKINSNLLGVIKPEEMDLLLYSEVLRYINQRTRVKSNDKLIGFQKDKKRYEDLKALIDRPTILPVYENDDRSVFCYIPSKCFRIIKDRSRTKDLCGQSYNPSITVSTINTAVYKLANTGVNNYQNFVFKLDGVDIFRTIDYPQFSSGLAIPEMKFEMIGFMLENIRQAGYEAKYENFDDLFYRESIIIRKNNSFNYTTIYNGGSPTVVNSFSASLNKINPITSNEYDNILISTEEYNDMLNSAFGTTKNFAPISIYENGKIVIFHNKKFIVSSVSLDFIRIPRKISLPLNQSCDLDPSVHEEIVDNLAKRLAAITSAENYNQLVRENLLKE